MHRWGDLQDQRGQAMAEFAVYLPVLVLLIVVAFYVAEIGLHHQEGEVQVRHGAWHALRVPPGSIASQPETDLEIASLEPGYDADYGGTLYEEQIANAYSSMSRPIGERGVEVGFIYESSYWAGPWSSYSFTKGLILDPASISTTQPRHSETWDSFVRPYQYSVVWETWSAINGEPGGEIRDALLDAL